MIDTAIRPPSNANNEGFQGLKGNAFAGHAQLDRCTAAAARCATSASPCRWCDTKCSLSAHLAMWHVSMLLSMPIQLLERLSQTRNHARAGPLLLPNSLRGLQISLRRRQAGLGAEGGGGGRGRRRDRPAQLPVVVGCCQMLPQRRPHPSPRSPSASLCVCDVFPRAMGHVSPLQSRPAGAGTRGSGGSGQQASISCIAYISESS